MTEKTAEREALEAKANELGVKFAANIGDETLAARVAEAEAARGAAAGSDASETAPAGAEGAPAGTAADLAQDQGAEVAAMVSQAKELGLGIADMIEVIGPRQGRRRAGRAFGPEPVLIPMDELSEADLQALEDDPLLIVAWHPAIAAAD